MRAETFPRPRIKTRARLSAGLGFAISRPIAAAAGLALLAITVMAVFAPLLAPHDPLQLLPALRLKPPSDEFPLGTDAYGRDLLSRVIYGGRVSLILGIGTAVVSVVIGLPLGLLAGYFDWVGAVLLRVMDGLMAIPSILLAMAIVSLWGASLQTVLAAIAIPEIPRVVRLVRSIVISAREEPYVEAAIAAGTTPFHILWRHLMPNTIAPLIVQGTFICASAILTEAILSFVGVGIPPETPSWGNIMAEGRTVFQVKPSLIFWPGFVLSLTILSVNLLGDAARDALDPRMKQREARP
jgi:peptide/nickel transport system permease protein